MLPKKKAPCLLFFILFCSLLVHAEISFGEVAIIKIRFRQASDMLPLVKALLSPEGRATVDGGTNSIVLSDDGPSLQRIRQLLGEMDRPVPQVKIRFKFQEEGNKREQGVSVSGKVSGEGWSVSAGRKRKDGVSVSVRNRKVLTGRESESFVTVLSGSVAYIRVGKEVPYRSRWVHLSRRYAHFVETVSFKRIETGMEVRPVIAGDYAHVEITPRVSYGEAGARGVIRFTEASTKLALPRGQWVTLGGSSKNTNEVISHILSWASGEGHRTLSLRLMAEF